MDLSLFSLSLSFTHIQNHFPQTLALTKMFSTTYFLGIDHRNCFSTEQLTSVCEVLKKDRSNIRCKNILPRVQNSSSKSKAASLQEARQLEGTVPFPHKPFLVSWEEDNGALGT